MAKTESVVNAITLLHVIVFTLSVVTIVGSSVMLTYGMSSMGSSNLALGMVSIIWALLGPGTMNLLAGQRDQRIFFGFVIRTMIVLIIQIVLGGLSLGSIRGEGKAVKELQHIFDDHWKEPDNEPEMKPLMNLQTKFECCGVHSAHDWYEHKFTILPHSCYNVDEKLIEKGCLRAIKDYSDDFFALATIDMVLLEIFSIFMATSLYQDAGNAK